MHVFIFHCFIFFYLSHILFFAKGRNSLVMLLFSSRLVLTAVPLLEAQTEPQEALIVGIENYLVYPEVG